MSFNFGPQIYFTTCSTSEARRGGIPACCFDSFIDFSCCCQLCVDVDDERKEQEKEERGAELYYNGGKKFLA